MHDFDTLIGSAAALCTTLSYLPQLNKSWASGETGDLSLKMLVLLTCGFALWIGYGLARQDLVIVAANVMSLAFVAGILSIKLRKDCD